MDLKIVILGDAAVGKSSLLAEKFSPYTKITFEPDLKTRQFTVDNQIVNVKFWDMPGRRDSKSLIMSNLQGTDCCVIVYDVTSFESFKSLEYWRKEFLEGISLSNEQWFPFIAVGNKIDLHHRMVNEEMISSWCIANEVLLYFEISAKCPTDVSDAFQLIVNRTFDHKYHNTLKRNMNEETEISNRRKTRSFCCGFFSCFLL